MIACRWGTLGMGHRGRAPAILQVAPCRTVMVPHSRLRAVPPEEGPEHTQADVAPGPERLKSTACRAWQQQRASHSWAWPLEHLTGPQSL